MDTKDLFVQKSGVRMYTLTSGQRPERDYLETDSCWISWIQKEGKFLIYKADFGCHVQLVDDTGSIYVETQISEYPGNDLTALENTDRYFILRIRIRKQEGIELSQLVGLRFSSPEDAAAVTNSLKCYFIGFVQAQKRRLEAQNDDPNVDAKKIQLEQKSDVIESEPEMAVANVTEVPVEVTKALGPPEVATNVQSRSNEDTEKVQSPKSIQPAPISNTTNGHSNFDMQFLAQQMGYKYMKNNMFQCHKCPTAFATILQIKIHWERAHNFYNISQCNKCQLPFPTWSDYRMHRNINHGFRRESGKKFKREGRLQGQMELLHHPTNSLIIQQMNPEWTSERNGLFRCIACPSKFWNQTELVSHQLVHGNNYECNICGGQTRFPTPSGLQAHYGTYHPNIAFPWVHG